VITLNRPKQRNALNDALMDELGAGLKAYDADDGIGCIVVTAGEKAFAAGADIAAMAKFDHTHVYKTGCITRNWETLTTIRKPVIAAVAGFALGGGCEVAMMCDFIIPADRQVQATGDQARRDSRRGRDTCRTLRRRGWRAGHARAQFRL